SPGALNMAQFFYNILKQILWLPIWLIPFKRIWAIRLFKRLIRIFRSQRIRLRINLPKGFPRQQFRQYWPGFTNLPAQMKDAKGYWVHRVQKVGSVPYLKPRKRLLWIKLPFMRAFPERMWRMQ